MRQVLLFAALSLASCMRDECSKDTTLLDPGWHQKWMEQLNGVATYFWCECHTAQPVAPSVMFDPDKSVPIRGLADGFPWGMGAWMRVTPEMVGPKSVRFVAIDKFEKQTWNCTSAAKCYDLLQMMPDTCPPAPSGATSASSSQQPGTPPGVSPGASTSGDYP